MRRTLAVLALALSLIAAFTPVSANEADDALVWPRPFPGAPSGEWPPCSGPSDIARQINCIESVTWLGSDGREVPGAFVANAAYDPRKPTSNIGPDGNKADSGNQGYGQYKFDLPEGRAGTPLNFSVFSNRAFFNVFASGDRMLAGDRFRIVLKSDVMTNKLLALQSSAAKPVFTQSTGADGIGRLTFEASAAYAASPISEERQTAMCTRDTKAVIGYPRLDIYGLYVTDFPYLAQYPGQLIISSNAVHSLALPEWDARNAVLRFQSCAPHYDVDGSIYKGYYEAVIGGKLARGLWKMDPKLAAAMARVEISYTDGSTPDIATINSNYDPVRDEIRLVAYNFHYSSPTISVRVTKPAAKKTTITCTKGKSARKVSGVSPKCPTGWKKK